MMKKVTFVVALLILMVACNGEPTATAYPVPEEDVVLLNTRGFIPAWYEGEVELVPEVFLERSPQSLAVQRSSTPFENINGLQVELKPGFEVYADGGGGQFVIQRVGTEFWSPIVFDVNGDVVQVWSDYAPIYDSKDVEVEYLVFPTSEDIYIRTAPSGIDGSRDVRFFLRYDNDYWWLSLWGDLQ